MSDDGREQRKAAYADLVDTWCRKHGITRESALSIIIDDGPFGGVGRPDVPTYKDLFAWREYAEFATELMQAFEPPKEPSRNVLIQSSMPDILVRKNLKDLAPETPTIRTTHD